MQEHFFKSCQFNGTVTNAYNVKNEETAISHWLICLPPAAPTLERDVAGNAVVPINLNIMEAKQSHIILSHTKGFFGALCAWFVPKEIQSPRA